jgi:hypothetical protein
MANPMNIATGGHAARSHKRFAASSAERWMACPGSIRLCDGLPETTSAYAAEGTLAHEWLQYKMVGGRKPDQDATPEMLEAVEEFKAIIKREVLKGPEWVENIVASIVEKQVAFSSNSDVGGTMDYAACISEIETAWFFDFKYGAGVPVDVIDNKQLRIYAQATIDTYGWNPATIHLGIFQPRAFHEGGRWRTETITPADLLDFHTDVEEAVARALEPDAPLIPGEAQCRWCPAKLICPAREKMALDAFAGVKLLPVSPNGLTPERVGDVLSKKDMVIDWLDAVEQEGYRLAMSGVVIPGFKLVAPVGKRQWEGDVRSIADELAVLTKSLPDDFLVEKLIGVIEAEKKVKKFGKEAMEKFAKLTVKGSSGKLQLVGADDARPAQLPASQAFEGVTYIPTGETE